jgi:starch-binding outer membrane protein, SusD/RagB family
MKPAFQYLIIPLVLLTILSLLSSCKKFIEIDNPKDQVVSELVFSNDAAANSAIAGMYSNMMSNAYFFANGGITISAGLSADEIYNRITSGDETHFYQNSVSPSDEFILNTKLWSAAYKTIYHANAIIEGLQKASGLTSSVKSQLMGEAKFIRGFQYFYLINLFGDIPLVLSTDYTVNSNLPRTATTEVYGQIINDLLEAQQLLDDSYPSISKVRPNKWTATALLSRVYLYVKDWQHTEAAANEIINSGTYNIVSNLDEVFLPNSNEIIFQLIPVAGSKTPTEAQAFLPASSSSARPLYPLTLAAANSFETNDQRKISWTKNKSVSGTPYYYSMKYKVKVPVSDPEEYNVVFRLAEIYLIRAEARAELGDYSGSQADLNIIRNRAGLPNTIASDKQTLLEAIEKERRIELLCEWGHRWLDLKRWNKADIILSIDKSPNWQSTDILYPIPLTEMKRNPSLVQNPGY